jgi:hypothetical protein
MVGKRNMKTLIFVLITIALSQAGKTAFDKYCQTQTHSFFNRVEYKICSKSSSNYFKSVVVLEGFDIPQKKGDQWVEVGTLEKLAENLDDSRGGKIAMMTNLIKNGYTIVLVNFPDIAFKNMETNGSALSVALEDYWQRTAKSQPLQIVGISMGGILATIATMYADQGEVELQNFGERSHHNLTFKVSKVITLDTPHNGAYIPTSVQNFIHMSTYDPDIVEKSKTMKKMLSKYHDLFQGPVATSLLYHNVFDNTGAKFDHFQEYYQGVRKKAKESQTRFVGFVSGSWSGNEQGLPDDNGKPALFWKVDWKANSYLMNEIGVPTGCGFWSNETCFEGLQLNLYPQKANATKKNISTKMRLGYGDKDGGSSDIWFDFNREWDCVGWDDCHSYENASGGSMPMYQIIWSALEDWRKSNFPDRYGTRYLLNNGIHNFVPTSSAAALEIDNYLLDPRIPVQDLEAEYGNLEQHSFLDTIYHQNENLGHARIVTVQQQKWLMDELRVQTTIVPTIITPLLLN